MLEVISFPFQEAVLILPWIQPKSEVPTQSPGTSFSCTAGCKPGILSGIFSFYNLESQNCRIIKAGKEHLNH